MSSTFSEKNSWHKQWIVANQNKRIYGSSKMISIFLAPFHPIHPHCLPVEQTSTCLVCKHINCLANSFCTITGGRIWTTIMCRIHIIQKVMYKHIFQRLLQKMNTPRLSWRLPLPEVPLFLTVPVHHWCQECRGVVHRPTFSLFKQSHSHFKQYLNQFQTGIFFPLCERGGGRRDFLWRHTKDSILGRPSYFEPGRKNGLWTPENSLSCCPSCHLCPVRL